MNHPWQVALRWWQEAEWKQGLTFPFLLAVERIATPDNPPALSRSSIERVFDEARNYRAEWGHYCIRRCPDRDKWILGWIDGEASGIRIPADDGASPVLSMQVASVGSNPRQGALDLIWNEAANAVESGRLSVRGKIWQVVSPEEDSAVRRWLAAGNDELDARREAQRTTHAEWSPRKSPALGRGGK